MNKKEAINELNNFVKDIDSRFCVSLWFKEDVVLMFNYLSIATFKSLDPNHFNIEVVEEDLAPIVAKTGIINKFYKKGFEVLNKQITKYTVRISNSPETYLHANSLTDYGGVFFDYLSDETAWKNKFTKEEIESFKKRDDIAIDWDKAIIEDVKD